VELSNAGTIDNKALHTLVPDQDPTKINLPIQPSAADQISCSSDNPDGCLMCGS